VSDNGDDSGKKADDEMIRGVGALLLAVAPRLAGSLPRTEAALLVERLATEGRLTLPQAWVATVDVRPTLLHAGRRGFPDLPLVTRLVCDAPTGLGLDAERLVSREGLALVVHPAAKMGPRISLLRTLLSASPGDAGHEGTHLPTLPLATMLVGGGGGGDDGTTTTRLTLADVGVVSDAVFLSRLAAAGLWPPGDVVMARLGLLPGADVEHPHTHQQRAPSSSSPHLRPRDLWSAYVDAWMRDPSQSDPWMRRNPRILLAERLVRRRRDHHRHRSSSSSSSPTILSGISSMAADDFSPLASPTSRTSRASSPSRLRGGRGGGGKLRVLRRER
jgi:hypothetical protein